MTARSRTAAVVAAVCLLSGCGVRPTGVVSAGEAPTATATSLPRSQVFFLLGGKPTPVTRMVPPWDTQAVFDALLVGPTAQEHRRGLRTEVTPDVSVKALQSKVVFVDAPKMAAKGMGLGYQQISCTALLLPGSPIVRISGPLGQKFAALGIAACPGVSPPSGAMPGGVGVPRASSSGDSGAESSGVPEPAESPEVVEPDGGLVPTPRAKPRPSKIPVVR